MITSDNLRIYGASPEVDRSDSLQEPPSINWFGGDMHTLRTTPVRKKPRNIDEACGSDDASGGDSGENWGGGPDGDLDQDSDHFG